MLSMIVLAFILSGEDEPQAEAIVVKQPQSRSPAPPAKNNYMQQDLSVPSPPLVGQDSKGIKVPSLESQARENRRPPLRRYGYFPDGTSNSPAPYSSLSSVQAYDTCGNMFACPTDREPRTGELLKDVVELRKVEPDFYEQQLRIPAPITTRRNVHTRQVGTLTGDDGTLMSLYGKPLYGGSTRWQYFAVHGNDSTRYSVRRTSTVFANTTDASSEFGSDEIRTGESVTVPSLNGESYTAEIYSANDIRFTEEGVCH